VYFEYIGWQFAGRLLDRVNTPISPNPLGLRMAAQAGIKEGTLLKSGYTSDVGLSSVKIVADGHRHAAHYNKHWRRAF